MAGIVNDAGGPGSGLFTRGGSGGPLPNDAGGLGTPRGPGAGGSGGFVANPAGGPAIVWPVPASHDMLAGFGAGTSSDPFGFHEGIDIRASGNGGENIVAARGGKVVNRDAIVDGGFVTIEVGVGGENKQYDTYRHVNPILGVTAKLGGAPGQALNPNPLFEASDDPYVPDLPADAIPPPLSTWSFHLGEPVGVEGNDNYLPSYLTNVYLLPEPTSPDWFGWREDDPLSGFVSAFGVMIDENGQLPQTEGWIADQLGTFNIIVDYDNDGLFTYGLDSIGRFDVVDPDPMPTGPSLP